MTENTILRALRIQLSTATCFGNNQIEAAITYTQKYAEMEASSSQSCFEMHKVTIIPYKGIVLIRTH